MHTFEKKQISFIIIIVYPYLVMKENTKDLDIHISIVNISIFYT